uniref:Uncharacterized protein n=1 Tax=Myotis myotis TaxID=51298 RepID=A0A7J7XHM2_MYOMY|nr:hypothetical protein mMyoMyo1_011767 [Myotis myotis]
MWRRSGPLPPLPLPPRPSSHSAWARLESRGDKARGAPCFPPPPGPLSRRLAHSALASRAPAFGRYSPPLCRGNKMATSAARAPCARTRPPPSRPLVWRQRLAWGVRAHRAPGLSLPRPGLLSVAALRVRARAGNTHPLLRPRASGSAGQERLSPPSSSPPLLLFVPLPPRIPGGS